MLPDMDRGSAQEAVIGRAVAVIVHTAEVELTVASQMQDFINYINSLPADFQ